MPSELDDMMIIGGIGVSIDLLFDDNELAREKINDALDVEGVSFADVLINFTSADQLFWLTTRQVPANEETLAVAAGMEGVWDSDGNWHPTDPIDVPDPDAPEISWTRTTNLLVSYNYTGGFLTSGTFYTGFEVTNGTGEIQIAVERGDRRMSDTVFVEEGKSYTLEIRIGLTRRTDPYIPPGTYQSGFVITSPSAPHPANATFNIQNDISVGSLLSVKLNGKTLKEDSIYQTLHGVTWGSEQFVTVGNFGTIGISPDGFEWTVVTSGTDKSLYGVTWSGSQFVVVGKEGTILTSPEGVEWTKRTSGTSEDLQGVTWSGSQFVAVGYSDTILTSPDGVNWTRRNSGNSERWLRDVTWDGNQFVAVGGIQESVTSHFIPNAGIILTSPDGVEWTLRHSSFTKYLLSYRGVAWSGSKFVVVPSDGPILISSNGVTWTKLGQDFEDLFGYFSPRLRGVTWDNGQFVAVGTGADIVTSPDGLNWTKPDTKGSSGLNDVAWGADRFVAVGSNGESYIQISFDGITWTSP